MYTKAYVDVRPLLNKTFTKAHPYRTMKVFRASMFSKKFSIVNS